MTADDAPPLRAAASRASRSRGRRHPEPETPTRDAFQRDRDRIVHSTAFRRLVYKTQVFVNHEGDLFRTRMTHSLEVAQIARSIARRLRLNEPLVEAIALAHDLGHTPFGHAGQDALNDCLHRLAPAGHGGFEHNLQSLRVVDRLEQRYPSFDGLNLSFETREGILKHCSPRHARRLDEREPGGVARRFLERTQPGLEAQLANLADEIAYSAHDVDDGVRSGLLAAEQLDEVAITARLRREVLADHPTLGGRRLLFEIIRRLLSEQIHDVVDATALQLDEAAPADEAAVRRCPPLLQFSVPMREAVTELKRFLHAKLYRHPRVVETTDRARLVVDALYAAYLDDPRRLPDGAMPPDVPPHRAVADYVAGMTDRFAVREHERLIGPSPFA